MRNNDTEQREKLKMGRKSTFTHFHASLASQQAVLSLFLSCCSRCQAMGSGGVLPYTAFPWGKTGEDWTRDSFATLGDTDDDVGTAKTW